MNAEQDPQISVGIQLPTNFTEQQMERLFGTDLEHLRDTDAFDIFYNDSSSGFDALEHILIGDDEGGFHCEQAASMLGLNHPVHREKTIVEREYLKMANSETKRDFAERPFEPHAAKVVIRGVKKVIASSASNQIKKIHNSMYPTEYDPASVVKTINIAYSNMDKNQDKVVVMSDGRKAIINSSGYAPMLDGTTSMPVRMILDYETRKVISAYPVVKTSGYMKLSDKDIQRHLFESPVVTRKQ